MVGFSSVFAVLLTLVAALGVFNTVLLNTRERRRDLGMLKSIGMTPWQVTAMTTTSMALLGAASGLLGIPLGMAGHRIVVDNVGSVVFPDSVKAV
ncbi:FtsX-like permease family protein [Nonomuraea mangrovi]|uniref:FtsX-like permease family protein n=1 Tax=Nonomuraea mangrovi TaxID=2316207 RepID=A0ABW4T4Z2_9ACTN